MAMGAQIQGVVVAWQMYDVTRDPLALGLVGLAEAAPFIGFALYAGHVADVRDRRRIALVGAGAAVRLRRRAGRRERACSSRPGRGRPGALIQGTIYAVIVVCGAARSFLLPARNALGADLVPRPLFPSAVAWRAGIWQVAAVAGPALGGVFYAWLGPDAFLRDRRGADGGVAVHRGAHSRCRARAGVGARRTRRSSPASARAWPSCSRARSSWAPSRWTCSRCCSAARSALLPIFAAEILHVGPSGLGALRAAPAIGAVLMSGVHRVAPAGTRARAGRSCARWSRSARS